MKNAPIPRSIVCLIILLAGSIIGTPAFAQPIPAPVPSEQVETPVDSGFVENTGDAPAIVFTTTIQVPRAPWLRLNFAEVMLAGGASTGNASYLLITSPGDGAAQTMWASHVSQWRNTSAYFNGDAVEIDLIAFPHTGPNRIVIHETTAGLLPDASRSICGSTDDRQLSNDSRAGRLMPIGCTAWMIDDPNHCFLTAGHCISPGTSGDVVEFNVPLSNPSGSVNHPPPQDQYAVDPVSIQSNGGQGTGNDWAYFGCFDNSTTGLTPFEAQGAFYTLAAAAPPVAGQTIRITGYGTVSSPVSPTWNQVQKTHTGPYVSHSGTTLQYAVDTSGGNSGSPVLDETGGLAIGIHTHAGCNTSGGNHGTAVEHAGLQNALANPLGVCIPRVLDFVYPDGFPDLIDPNGGTAVRVEVSGLGGNIAQPGTGQLHYDAGLGIVTIPMQEVPLAGPNVYDAVFPAINCGTFVDFYVSAQTTGGVRIFDPFNAPTTTFNTTSGSGITTIVAFDFETAPGWTVQDVNVQTGTWERGIPVGGGARGDPPSDFDGSGQCWVTANAAGDSDVDGGPTRLISPAFDLSTSTDPVLTYARWFTNDDQDADRLDVEISDNNGATWTLIESVPGTVGWVVRTARITDFVGVTSQVKLRFSATDNPNNSVTEAGLDAFAITEIQCGAPVVCTKGDVNQDGVVNGADVGTFTSVLVGGGTPGTVEFCAVDMDDDGLLEVVDDVSLFVTCLLGVACP